ncbi:MAG: DUF3368 domain-containing protein [Desulfohalobiaceae bacterium]
MKVVSNSSILIGLSAIERLDLLQYRFPEEIIIPGAVWNEVVETGQGMPGAKQVSQADWIIPQNVQNNVGALSLQSYLDYGEAEVIALGQEIGANLLLLDEKSARNVAARLGHSVLGTVGVLIWARRSGLLPNLSHELELLQQKGGFRIGQEVYECALKYTGE